MLSIFCILFLGAFCVIQDINIWPYPASFVDTAGGKKVTFDTIKFQLFDEKTKKYIPIEKDSFINPLVERYTPFLYANSQKNVGGVEYPVTFFVEDITTRDLTVKTNESYQLNIDENGCGIYSANIFGSLRGLETFTQLVNSKTIDNLPLRINDFPRFEWRGVMIDVARHYIKLDTLKKIVDAMQYNKLNSLHIHLIDAQSFPLEVPKYPLLSEKGAYDPKNAIFTAASLTELKEYSYLRGIRVTPEIDVPGHAASWGKGYPGSTAICDLYKSNINNIPLDPTVPLSHELTQGIIDALAEIFDDDFFHFGGDEVVYGCWDEIKNISEYMKKHDMDGKDLQGWFMSEAFKFTKKKPIVWQELAQKMPEKSKYQLPKDIIVEVWKNPEDMREVISNGYEQIINSAGWYFDRQVPIAGALHYLMLDVWMDMWALEPENYIDQKDWSKILGGEGCQWGEQINDFVVIQRIFPKACAVAERLWSPKSVNVNKHDISELERRAAVKRREIEDSAPVRTSLDVAEDRLMHHICHNLNQRGIGASPIRPDYCYF